VNTACRLFRIPDSVNLKPGRNGWQAKLVECDDSIVYTLGTLAKALGVKPGKPIEPKLDSGERPGAGKPDPMLEWLQAKGLWTNAATGGWHLIQCPFADEHTDDRVDAKYLPTFASMDGKHKVECHHGHGEDKAAYFTRFMEWAAAEGAPTAGTDPAKLREMFKAIWTGPLPTPQAAPLPPGTAYDEITLADALGPVPITALHKVKKTTTGKVSATQDCSNANVLACCRYLGVEPKLNLMTGTTSYVLPERIDPLGFGVLLPYQIDRMIHGALRDAIHEPGLAKKEIDDNLTRIAERNQWHPAKDWIESIPWDGQDRLEDLCKSVTTQAPGDFKRLFRRWALQSVEAACGWAADRTEQEKALCFVLAGDQGIGKTRWLMSLAPQFSVRGKHLSLDGSASAARDSIHEALQGWIVELGELDTTFGKSANGSLKAFLSNTTDQYRLPYAEAWGRRPRCTSFCASVNDAQFLKDDTGSRRYIVFWVTECDVDHCTDMQQFWAQMHHVWKGGEQHYLTAAEEKLQITGNAQHQAEDAIADMVGTMVEKRREQSGTYTHECSVLAADIGQMLDLRVEQVVMLRRVAGALKLHLGPKQNLDKRGGHREGWKLWLDAQESRRYGKLLRPSKA
jgi:hypothetical protein